MGPGSSPPFPAATAVPPLPRLGPPLLEKDIGRLETEVVPRYLTAFSSLAVSLLLPSEPASVIVVGSRAGIESDAIATRLPSASLKGLETSDAALRRATERVSQTSIAASFEVARGLPTQLPSGGFTHALAVHPICSRAGRKELLLEMTRLLSPRGQAVVSIPLRGSFPEIVDLVREYALKNDLAKLGEAVDVANANRPTPETISDELEAAGFVDVEVDVQLLAVRFESGAAFLRHAIYELMVAPDARAAFDLAPAVMSDALVYVEMAIKKYWAEGEFELTVNVGAASGRRA